ncbi:MAG: c-type cytochrome [Cyanobacteria bacterium]|nr:c-type cytochrome [Synechococcus sp. BS307-5m-G38]MDA0258239.1 c-type cytochrome [Cyanobacteriota bacterium]MEB3247605.1 c-type cytochrome [Synechococcus sp.]OUW28992.1 MAG: cytochrome C [Cyanobacteria bacterium TMED177]
MIEPTSTAAEQQDSGRGLITALVVLAASACVVLLLWVINSAQQDPYVRASLEIQGDPDHGGQLFRINCAGCHGLAGQGLLAPQLIGITDRLRDPALIHQIVSGDTPPMPSFQMAPEAMADLLSHLHELT